MIFTSTSDIRGFVATLLTIVSITSITGQDFSAWNAEEPELQCGVVIEDMFNLDYEKSTIEIIFWLWVRSKENPYPLKAYIDIRGATALEMGGVFVDTLESEGELFYLTQVEIHAEILSAFDDSRYPLDDQHVELVIEFTHFFAEDVTVRLAEDDLAVNPEYLQTWRITNIQSSIL